MYFAHKATLFRGRRGVKVFSRIKMCKVSQDFWQLLQVTNLLYTLTIMLSLCSLVGNMSKFQQATTASYFINYLDKNATIHRFCLVIFNVVIAMLASQKIGTNIYSSVLFCCHNAVSVDSISIQSSCSIVLLTYSVTVNKYKGSVLLLIFVYFLKGLNEGNIVKPHVEVNSNILDLNIHPCDQQRQYPMPTGIPRQEVPNFC